MRNCENEKMNTNLAVVNTTHTSIVARAQRLGAVGALEATDLVEHL